MSTQGDVDAGAGEYPQQGRGNLPTKDVGRLLLRCADRPGLVAAVSTFLTQAGANIVSLDQSRKTAGRSSCPWRAASSS